MHTQNQQQHSATPKAINSAYAPPRHLYTLKKFAERHSDFITLSAVTNQVSNSVQ